VQGLLELAGLPYVGAGVLGSAVGMDKDVTKRLLASAGLPVVAHRTIRRAEWDRDSDEILGAIGALGTPVFVKPANMGSSVGVRRASSREEMLRAMDHAFEFDTKILVEAAVLGAREIECGILGNDDPIASVPGEIVPEHDDGFYSYDAKYVDDRGADILVPAELDSERAADVRRLAIAAFRALECAGMARVDFLLSADGRLFLNEIKTIPGFTAISMYPKVWAASGVGGCELVSRLIDLALERGRSRSRLRTSV